MAKKTTKTKSEEFKFFLYSTENFSYLRGVKDSLKVIIKLLKDNDISLKREEFYKEYNLLKSEGKL